MDNYSEFEEKNEGSIINHKETSDNNNKSFKLNKNSKRKEKPMETIDVKTEKEFMTAEQFEMIVKALQLVNANVKQDLSLIHISEPTRPY